MTKENLEDMILYVLQKSPSIATYVIKNKVNNEFKKHIETTKVRNCLKRLLKDGKVKNVDNQYKTMLSWEVTYN